MVTDGTVQGFVMSEPDPVVRLVLVEADRVGFRRAVTRRLRASRTQAPAAPTGHRERIPPPDGGDAGWSDRLNSPRRICR